MRDMIDYVIEIERKINKNEMKKKMNFSDSKLVYYGSCIKFYTKPEKDIPLSFFP